METILLRQIFDLDMLGMRFALSFKLLDLGGGVLQWPVGVDPYNTLQFKRRIRAIYVLIAGGMD